MKNHEIRPYFRPSEFSNLVGKTITKIEKEKIGKYKEEGDALVFYCKEGSIYRMVHHQDCCETVILEDVIGGELSDLEGETVVSALVETNGGPDEEGYSFTYTFYTIRTHGETVTLRWYGESNGYYSEDVDFEEGLFPDFTKVYTCYPLQYTPPRGHDFMQHKVMTFAFLYGIKEVNWFVTSLALPTTEPCRNID